MWYNYHTHTHYCDGKASVADVVLRAQQLGLRALGLSSHAPLPFHRPWCMKSDQLQTYLADIDALRHTPGLQVYAGLEVDYIPGVIAPAHFAHQLDYTIGSIHFVDELPSGDRWEIDATRAHFEVGLNQTFHGNIRAAIERYYELTREMVAWAPPTLVGHLDKIKMHNPGEVYFKESEPWYQAAVSHTLDAIGKAGCIIEVNTRGLYQKKTNTVYPSPWILQQIYRRGIPVTLSSDAHHPDDLVNEFAHAAHILVEIGFQKLRILLDGKWQDVAFDLHGIQPQHPSHHPVA